MTASLRRTLRNLGTWMLGLAVPLAACASTPMPPAAAELAAITAESGVPLVLDAGSATARRSFRPDALEGFALELTTPAKSAGHRYNQRISAEDTTPPTLDALEVSRFRIPMEREARHRPAPPVWRSPIASPATRQRAP